MILPPVRSCRPLFYCCRGIPPCVVCLLPLDAVGACGSFSQRSPITSKPQAACCPWKISSALLCREGRRLQLFLGNGRLLLLLPGLLLEGCYVVVFASSEGASAGYWRCWVLPALVSRWRSENEFGRGYSQSSFFVIWRTPSLTLGQIFQSVQVETSRLLESSGM